LLSGLGREKKDFQNLMKSIKLVVVGDSRVGKTCQVLHYITSHFPQEYVPTAFDKYNININIDGKTCGLEIFDNSGSDDYSRVRPLSYGGVEVLLVVFAVDSPDSFDNVHHKWVPEIKAQCPNVPFVLVGNKTDLRDDPEVIERLRAQHLSPISMEQGEELAIQVGAWKYVECSAKSHDQLKPVFDEAIRAAFSSQACRLQAISPMQAIKSFLRRLFSRNFKSEMSHLVLYLTSLANQEAPAESAGVDLTSKLRFVVSAGQFEQSGSSVVVTYKNEEPSVAEKSIIISFSFVVKNDVDTFSLGELSGSVKQILGLAKSKAFNYDLKSSLATHGDGNRVYTLKMVVKEDDIYEQIQNLFAAYAFKSAQATLELNQTFGQRSSEYPQALFKFEAEIPRLLMKVLQRGLPQVSQVPVLGLLGLTRDIVFETHFDSVQDFLAESSFAPQEELKRMGLSALLQNLIASFLSKYLLDEKIPEPLRHTYERLSFLSAVDSISLSFGRHTLHAQCSNMDLFALLPTLKELRASK